MPLTECGTGIERLQLRTRPPLTTNKIIHTGPGGISGQRERVMKRMTGILIRRERHNDGLTYWALIKDITCEVSGEMSDGTKVWTDLESGEQYYLMRIKNKYLFYKE